MKYLIIGGVAGGATTAARLRRNDEKSSIVMLERGEYISYANCGLPYYIGGEIKERNNLFVQTPETFGKRFNIDVRNFSEAIAIHPDKKVVEVKNLQTGEIYEEPYDKLVLSPGAEPVKPHYQESMMRQYLQCAMCPTPTKSCSTLMRKNLVML